MNIYVLFEGFWVRKFKRNLVKKETPNKNECYVYFPEIILVKNMITIKPFTNSL
jgi:hypothetical protein